MQAQVPATAKKHMPDTGLFKGVSTAAEAEEALMTFGQQQGLKNYGGWKWYGRFLNEYAQRSNPDGSLPSATECLKEINRVKSSQLANRGVENGWYPIGPFNKPQAFGSLLSYGMCRANCVAFHPTNNAEWYVGYGQAGIWKTIDTGNTWTEMNNGLPILRISDIAIDPNNPSVLYACLGDYEYGGVSLLSMDRKRNTHFGMGIYKSTDGGLNWSPTGLSAAQTDFDGSLFRRVFVNPANSNEVIAGGISGIYRSNNAGASWTKINGTAISDMEMVEKSPNIIYASGRWLDFFNIGSAKTLKSYDFGKTWTELTIPWPAQGAVSRVELALAPSDTGYVYAVCAGQNWGDLYGLYVSKNGGKTWSKTYNLKNNLLSNEPQDSTTVGYSQGEYDLALCVNPTDKNKLYLGGIQSLFSNDGGANFELVDNPIYHVDHHQYKIHPKLNIWVACNDGGLYVLDPDPVTTSFDLALSNSFNEAQCAFKSEGMNIGSYYRVGLDMRDTTSIIAGAQDNGTVAGNSWFYTSGGDGMDCGVWGNNWISSAQYGAFYHFKNGVYDFGFRDGNNYEGNGEWTTPFYADYRFDADLGEYFLNDVYVLYNQLVSANTGWVAVSNFTNKRVGTAMDISNPDTGRIYIAKKPRLSDKTPSEIWTKDFAGSNWQNITAGLPDSLYVTDIATNPQNGQQAWVTLSGFVPGQKVYYTKNAGKTWKNISYNLPNIPVNTVIYDYLDSSHGFYIGTDLGVYYLNDNVSTWKYFSKNLPNVIVSDLEMNPTNHTLYCSTFGRALWACTLFKVNEKNNVKNIALQDIKINNPVDKILHIQMPGNIGNNCGFDLLNQTGQLVKTGKLLPGENRIGCAEVKPGVYYLKLSESGNILGVEKIYIQ